MQGQDLRALSDMDDPGDLETSSDIKYTLYVWGLCIKNIWIRRRSFEQKRFKYYLVVKKLVIGENFKFLI